MEHSGTQWEPPSGCRDKLLARVTRCASFLSYTATLKPVIDLHCQETHKASLYAAQWSGVGVSALRLGDVGSILGWPEKRPSSQGLIGEVGRWGCWISRDSQVATRLPLTALLVDDGSNPGGGLRDATITATSLTLIPSSVFQGYHRPSHYIATQGKKPLF